MSRTITIFPTAIITCNNPKCKSISIIHVNQYPKLLDYKYPVSCKYCGKIFQLFPEHPLVKQ